MKLGTVIKFADGRRATMVYRGLDGDGIHWGDIRLTREDAETIKNSPAQGGLFAHEATSEEQPFVCQALLRKPFKGAGIECIDLDYEVVFEPEPPLE